MIELRPVAGDDWALWRAVRLDALGEAPEAFSSRLADWRGRGDSEQRWRARLETVPFNAVAFLSGRPVGQASGTCRDAEGSVELISMWVAPEARGQGVGDALVEEVIQWANSQSARRVVLRVRKANRHAIALYERRQFTATRGKVDDDEVEMTRSLATPPTAGRRTS